VETSPRQEAAFDLYLDLLIAESARANLTSLRDPEAIRKRHFAESLALLAAIDQSGALASPTIDIGSGAGLPGIPMAIMRPALRFTLLEATGKKAVFLRLAVRKLGLSGVTVVQGRAEDVARDAAHRDAYGLAVARTVAPLRVLVELALPFVRTGGYLAAQKGSGAEREVGEAGHAIEECGGENAIITRIAAPGATHQPALVLIRKATATPDRYPRRPGIPKKRPL
jgi:16S rRNA (guanine527-N7)-methyltransferase